MSLNVINLGLEKRVQGVNFQLQAGEILHILGANGSGKSSLLQALSGLTSYQGEVWLDELNLRSQSMQTLSHLRAYLTQSQHMAFNLSVSHFLSLARKPWTKKAEFDSALKSLAASLQIHSMLDKDLNQLSGGEFQRVRLVGIALQVLPRLNPQAKLLLLDEPAAPLDIAQQGLLYAFIDALAKEGLMVCLVSHDLNRSLQFADKVLLLKNGQVQGFGDTSQLMTSERLSALFDSPVERLDIAGKPRLLFN